MINFSKKKLNKEKIFSPPLKKKIFNSKLKNIILTSSDGYDLPFLHYTQLGIGNLILTYLYALFLKSKNINLDIIPFFPIRTIPLIRDFKYWYLRSSFELNYEAKHLIRILYFNILRKTQKKSFYKGKNLFLSTHIMNEDIFSYKKISSLSLNNVKKNIVSFLNFNYEIKKNNNLNLIKDKNKVISLGLHLRRGDFLHKGRKDLKKYKQYIDAEKNPNTSPDIISQINIIKKIKAKISIVNIYSDQSHSKTVKEIGSYLDRFKVNLFPVNANGSKVLKDMMKNDVLILSNSTLSITSCILSNQLALFKNQNLPNKIKKYFKNIKEIK